MGCSEVDTKRLSQFKYFLSGVGIQNPLPQVGGKPKLFRLVGKKRHADLTAPRVKIEGALRQFGQLCKAACYGQLVDGVDAQIFQKSAGEIAHVEQCNLGQVVDCLRRIFGRRAGCCEYVLQTCRT